MFAFQPSATVAVAAKVQELKSAGREVISFSIGVPNFEPPAHAYAAADVAPAKDPGQKYAPAAGLPALRKAFAERLKKDGFDYASEQTCVALGGKNALFNLFLLLLNEGDEIIIPAPYWTSYPDMVSLVGGTPKMIDCPAEQNYKLTPEQLDQAITPNTKAFIFNNPSNPTGMVYTKEEVAALAKVLAKHSHVQIISDDIYDKLIYDGEKFHHLTHAEPALKDRTFICQSISKTYGLPGWRVGMIAAPSVDMIKKLGNLGGQTFMNVPPVAQNVAEACFAGDHSFLEPIKAHFTQNRDIIMNTFDELDGVVCPKPQGAFYAFPDVSALFSSTIADDIAFCNALLEETGVALVPGSGFGAPNCVRFSYAVPKETLESGLEKFAAFCKSLG